MQTTDGHLLGGRLRYAQPLDGYRTGIEPVLLAAAVPAQPGERVLEAGTGAGAGLLCLAARVKRIAGTGVEIDPAMAELARRNLFDNDVAGVEVVAGDIAAAALGRFDHAFANPPWHDPRSTASPVHSRRLAKQGGGLELWIAAMARALRPGGSLTLVLPAAQAERARCAMQAAAMGAIVLQALAPKAGRASKLALVQARSGDRRPVSVPPAIVLHQADGAFTPAIEAALRHGAPLVLLS